MSRKVILILLPFIFLPGGLTSHALAVVGHSCVSDNKCDSGEVCATVQKSRTLTETQCYAIDSIPDGAQIQRTNDQSIQQICATLPNATSRFPSSCNVTPPPSSSSGGLTCSADQVPTFVNGKIVECKAKLPPLALSSARQQPGECDFNIPDVFNPVKILVCVIKNVISGIVSFFVTIALGLIDYAIKINSTIYSSKSLAKFGFDTSLQITNLLFVAGIIAIALGTMFRRSFGLQLLPRFAMIAFLIYFSFWAATALVKVSDKLTASFLASANFTANSFAPIQSNLNSGLGPYLGAGAEGIVGLFASIAFGMILIFALLAVAVIYIIRYIYLTLLIILLPLALFFSIFPGLNIGGAGGAWNRWIEQFTRWLIFGPIMAFFIYLSLAVLNSGYRPSSQTGEMAFGAIGDMLVLIGLLIFGLLTANSLGVAGSAYLNNLGKKGIGWARGAARKQAIRLASAPLRGEEGVKRMAAVQKLRIPGTKFLVPGTGTLAKGLGTLAISGEGLVKKDEFKNWSSDKLVAALPTLGGESRIAALSQLAKKGDMHKVNPDLYLNAKTENLFKSYNKDFSDITKAAGMNAAMKAAIAEVAAAEASGNEERLTQANDALTSSSRDFYATFSKKDWKNFPADKIYAKFEKGKSFFSDPKLHDVLQYAAARGILENNEGDVKRIMNVKSQNFESAHSAITRVASDIRRGDSEKADRIKEALEKTMARRRLGEEFEFPEPEEKEEEEKTTAKPAA